ncbi:hypothetical protein ACIPSR_12325 [Pectobacterium sp. CHL-2024]|uniref:hypothetical protein n=1 Tax=Pectobacterium TaxID=122277 RepID=UPI000C1BACF8|nr:hypothetical protein [Pectobacterium brasiliense]ATV44419.1 hypothetical protein CTV95_13585 [Pectobacterium brasiliense]MBA0210507.1 hypothetical protein [Pectobacterium brasiliense]MCA6982398.1 hypothetical protein [Pectobacterium brasiliense]MCH4991958.1 hypothetical protein [Pectobacterium brasiliense]
MRYQNYSSAVGAVLLLWSQLAFSLTNSHLSLEISAESSPKLTIYYDNKPVTGETLPFPLEVDDLSKKFTKESGYFYVVGNVDKAEIVFFDNVFELMPVSGDGKNINLQGSFFFNGIDSPVNKKIIVPVLKSVTDGNQTNGVKVRFSSEHSIDHYSQGTYANTFTLMVTPVI